MFGVRKTAAALALVLLPASAFAFRPCEVRSFSSGGVGTCALRFDGRLSCWGDSSVVPTLSRIPDGRFSQVSVLGAEACAIRMDGTVVCWGKLSQPPVETEEKFRQISGGVGVRTDGTLGYLFPYDPAPLLPEGTFLDVAEAYGQACARRTDRTVVCWVGADAPTGTFRQIDAGNEAACGIRDNGDLKCWGTDATTPGGKFQQVSLRRDGSYFGASALRENGEWIFWGDSNPWPSVMEGTFREIEYGAIPAGVKTGGGFWNAYDTLDGELYNVLPLPGPFTQLSTGGFTGALACGLDVDGYASCSGGNNVGWRQPPHERFRQISAGYNHACGIKEDNSVLCWGTQHLAPDGPFVQIDVEDTISCGLRENGSAVCWADQPEGLYQFGPLEGPFQQVDYGGSHVCALSPEGEVTCAEYWDEVPNYTPPSGPFTQISASGEYFVPSSTTCGLREDGSITCWGSNEAAIADVPDGEFVQVDVSSEWVCGLRPNGHAECWSDGDQHVLAPPDRIFTAIDGGLQAECGLEPDGTISCWPYIPFTSFCGVPLPGCGNGDLDIYEECDNGAADWSEGAACDDHCAHVPCGQPLHPDAYAPAASDALFTLHAAVGSKTCDLSVCDVNGSAAVTSNDALAILRVAVGIGTPLACEA